MPSFWVRLFGTSESPRLHKCVVAWMDVLGIADRINEAEKADGINEAEKLVQSNKLLVDWYNTLKNSRAWLEGKHSEWDCDAPPPRFILKAFSDNIIMVWPIQNSARNEAGQLLREALVKTSMFQRDMAANGFFVRGAITVGEIFIDELAVFGPALIRAHELEQSAGVPRIILDDSAILVNKRYRENYPDPASYPLSRYIEVGADGLNFVKYLEGVISPVEGYCDENTVRKHRGAIVLNLCKFQNMKGKTWHKYRWAAAYHNSFCDRHSKHLAKYKITCDETELPV